MMCSLLNEDEDKDNQVHMVFQWTLRESVHCKTYRAAQTTELQKTLKLWTCICSYSHDYAHINVSNFSEINFIYCGFFHVNNV